MVCGGGDKFRSGVCHRTAAVRREAMVGLYPAVVGLYPAVVGLYRAVVGWYRTVVGLFLPVVGLYRECWLEGDLLLATPLVKRRCGSGAKPSSVFCGRQQRNRRSK